MAAPLLELSGLAKSFGGVRALTDGTLALYPGQVTALVGENGAGKSTLVKILSGIHAPDAGTIRIDGTPVTIASPAMAQSLGISVIHQEAVIFEDLSVAENIFITDPPRRHGLTDWRTMRRRAGELLADLDPGIDPRTPARHLGVAQRHLIQIARALAAEARIVVMDEPTAALSHHEVEDLLGIARRLRAAGRAILFISHKFDELFALCDRFSVFRDGAAVADGMMADTDSDALIARMVGRPLDRIYPKVEVPHGAERLSVDGLSRAGEFEDVSFSVAAGEILGVYGLVGAGRSEVMQALFGITRPDGGTIRIDGRVVDHRRPAQAIGNGLVYVPEDRQHQGVALTLPIRDNMALASLHALGRAGLVDRRAERTFAATLAQRFQVKAADLAQPVGSLSGGNQQKVVLAKWMGTDPAVLILDEPTKGIDVGSKAAVHETLGALVQQGIAVVMVSSDLPEVLGMADRVMVMRRGRVSATLARADAQADDVMRAAAA